MGAQHALSIALSLLGALGPVAAATAAITAVALAMPATALAATPEGPMPVVIGGPAAAEIDVDAVAAAVGRELGMTAVLAATSPATGPTLEVEVRRQVVVVRHRRTDGRRIERSVARATEADDLPRVVARLAGNLVRDEAGELLEALAPRPEVPAADAPPAAAPSDPEAGTDAKGGVDPEPDAGGGGAGVEPTAAGASAAAPIAAGERAPRAPAGAKLDGERAAAERSAASRGPSVPHGCAASRAEPWEPARLALLEPVTLLPLGGDRRAAAQISALYGRSYALCGASIDGVVGWFDDASEGVHVAFVFGHSGRAFRGFRLTGVVGTDEAEESMGLSIAGGANLHLGRDEVPRHHGAQVAGLLNHAPDHDGAQIAGLFNDARDVRGVQISGVGNRGRLVEGVQIGVVNVAERVRGAQIGLVNVARRVEGAAIAPVNLVEEGRAQVVAYATNAEPVNAGVWFHVPPLVTITAVGFAFDVGGPSGATSGGGTTRIVPQVGLGGRVPFEPLYLDVAAVYAPEMDPSGTHRDLQTARFRTSLGWDVAPPLGVFAGAGVRYVVPESRVTPELSLGVTLF